MLDIVTTNAEMDIFTKPIFTDLRKYYNEKWKYGNEQKTNLHPAASQNCLLEGQGRVDGEGGRVGRRPEKQSGRGHQYLQVCC